MDMGSITEEIRERLFLLQDTKYRDFQSTLLPGQEPGSSIGVRTPALRSLARELRDRADIGEFLADVPHRYFDENQLHAFLISEIRDYAACLEAVEAFLPYVDNWATCDQMGPKVFRRHREELLGPVRQWLASGETYTVRFGIRMLMNHYLDEAFDPAYLDEVAAIRLDAYYVRMMVAWYMATALASQYDAAVRVLEERRLDAWTHNKAIQKAVESRRISEERKKYLRTLKMKGAEETPGRLRLVRPSGAYAEQIEAYRAAFPAGRMQATPDPERIPGMDGLENCGDVREWLLSMEAREGRVSWYMAVRASDGKVVGFSCLRHTLEEDDDEPPFASHIGYSVRPDEQGKGYGTEQLKLVLQEAKRLGIRPVRIICRDSNEASRRTIVSCGGQYRDSLYGEESGMTVCRFDVYPE